ncbi:hypothetical protein I4I80_02730 [Pseudomonas syringae pv. tomato]|nr:hypothetical protein [Pseudomonas syringae pv. tomato]MBW8023657.1 hypothetical protein [Pseudomonas syringae pv. tomato]
MPTLKSTLITGSKPEASTLLRVQEQMGLKPGQSMQFMVYEVEFDRKKYYCCWSGGEIIGGETHLTLVGQAAMEALANLPLGNNDALIVQELKLGPTPLRNKIKAAFKRAPGNSKICFVGDMQGELDGHMHAAFNIQAGMLDIAH